MVVMAEQQQQSASQNEPLRVDTDRIKPALSKLQELADRLHSAAFDLDTTSESYGEPWGNDETGEKFYEQYKDPHDQVVEAALQAGYVLADSTKQVTEMVKAFEAAEEQSAATSHQLGTSTQSGSDPGVSSNPSA